MKITIPTYIQKISNEFESNGFKLYLVGGCVRDAVLGKTPKDYDLTTDALPNKIVEMLSKFGWRINFQGVKFGVIALFGRGLPREGIEIATFRSDLTSGRNPEVKMGVSISDDVLRRDISFNGLFYNIQKEEIVDLTGGIDDLNNKIIRMIGDPFKRIEEDRLRILRVCRFSATLGFDIDKDTKEAIKQSDLSGVSRERIWDEFSKASKHFDKFLEIMVELKVINKCFDNVVLDTTIIKSDNYLIYLAHLFRKNSPKDISSILVRNKLDRDKSNRIAFLISFLHFNENNIYSIWNNYRKFNIYEKTILEWCGLNGLEELGLKFIKFKPVHDSKELMDLGFTGKKLGDEITKIEIENFLNIK